MKLPKHCYTVLISIILSTSHYALGQEKIEWSPDYPLTKADFKGIAPNTGTQQSVQAQSLIEFEAMNYQLLFSNLNSSVTCSFLPMASWLDEGDAQEELIRYARLTWDMYELGARKLRKQISENRMKLNPARTSEYYNTILTEISALQSRYCKETDYGRIAEKQKNWELTLAQLLEEYANYCKTCKAPKRRKKKH